MSKDSNWSFVMGDDDLEYDARFITNKTDSEAIFLAVNGVSMMSSTSPETNLFCGVSVDWPIVSDGLSATTVKATSLPAGLKLVQDKSTKAYSVTGVPTAASKKDKNGTVQSSVIKFTVTTAGKNSRAFTMRILVNPLPDFVVGSFDGGGDWGAVLPFEGFSSSDLGDKWYSGVSKLTISSTGKVSGKYTYTRSDGGKVLSATLDAKSIASTDGETFYINLMRKIGKASDVVTYELFNVDGWGGHINTEGPELFQNLWKRSDLKSSVPVFAKNFTLKLDNGLTLTIKKDGVVSFAGSVYDGTEQSRKVRISGTSQIYPEGEDSVNGVIGQVILYAQPTKTLPYGFFDIIPIAVEFSDETTEVNFVTTKGRDIPLSWKEGRFAGDIPRSSYLTGACYPAVFDLSANTLSGKITDVDGSARKVGPIKLRLSDKDKLVGSGKVNLLYYLGYSSDASSALCECDINITVMRQVSGDVEWGLLEIHGQGKNIPSFGGSLEQRGSERLK